MDINKVIADFDSMTKDAGRVQLETLKRILELNGSAEYLQKLGLNARTDPESFKTLVPLVAHKDIESYIQKIADGDSSPILTGKPLTALSLSSGTTGGKPKYVPFTEDLMDATLEANKTSFAFRDRDFPVGKGKALQFIYGGKQSITKGGMPVATSTTNVLRHPRYKNSLRDTKAPSCSPDEVIFGPDFHQSLYCHLLCELIFHDEIQFVSSTFAHSIVLAFRAFEQLWEELLRDIREGELSDRITAPSIRVAMSKILKPNPELADLLHKKCSKLNNWYGLIPELFPNVKYVYGVMTGSMEAYLKNLRHYAGSVPLCCREYGASESWIAANVNPKLPPELATFAVLPNIGYFEFLPIKDEAEQEPKPVGLTEVEIGKEYEIIVTSNGTPIHDWRCCEGDGLLQLNPELKFIRRRQLILNINIDKNTERDLQLSVEEAAKLAANEKIELVDYSSLADTTTDPGHYVILWEINGEASDAVLQQCCNCLDSSFHDDGYVTSRKSNAIGPLELRVVRKGTFAKIMEHFVGQGAAVSQFKAPRCIGPANNAVLQIFSSNVAKSYISTAY